MSRSAAPRTHCLFTLAVKSHVAAVLLCVATLTGSAVMPSFGSSAVPPQETAGVSSHLRGPCTDGARYTLSVERRSNELLMVFRVYGRPGSKWRYEASARSGTETTDDARRTMTVAPPPRPYWSGTLQWFVEQLRPRVTVRALGVSRKGEVCRASFTHRLG